MIALTQWKTEIEKFTDNTLTICTYHGPDRESQTPREMLKKYDIVLTTYQVVEADFRKMTSPNRVTCPNCGGKFKIDKLPIHLKYFCGDTAQKTEAQARQQRTADRGSSSGRRGRRPDRPFGKNPDKKDKKEDVAVMKKQKTETAATRQSNKENTQTKATPKKAEIAAATKGSKTAGQKKAPVKMKPSKSDVEEDSSPITPGRPSRSAARKAATQITKSAAEWMPPDDDSGSDVFKSGSESSSDDESEIESGSESESSDSDSDNSALQRIRAKQQQALERARKSGGTKKQSVAKKDGGKSSEKKGNASKKSFVKKSKKKFDDDFDDDSSGSDESDVGSGADNDIDMDALVEEAMEGG